MFFSRKINDRIRVCWISSYPHYFTIFLICLLFALRICTIISAHFASAPHPSPRWPQNARTLNRISPHTLITTRRRHSCFLVSFLHHLHLFLPTPFCPWNATAIVSLPQIWNLGIWSAHLFLILFSSYSQCHLIPFYILLFLGITYFHLLLLLCTLPLEY